MPFSFLEASGAKTRKDRLFWHQSSNQAKIHAHPPEKKEFMDVLQPLPAARDEFKTGIIGINTLPCLVQSSLMVMDALSRNEIVWKVRTRNVVTRPEVKHSLVLKSLLSLLSMVS